MNCWNCGNGLVIASHNDYYDNDTVCVMCGRSQNVLRCLDPTPPDMALRIEQGLRSIKLSKLRRETKNAP